MRRSIWLALLVVVTALSLVLMESSGSGAQKKTKTPKKSALPPAQQQVSGDQESNVDAEAAGEIEPQPFTSSDGKRRGWKLRVPGRRPLATPAVVEGKVFVGGGFGSHEFYAFDAATGRKVWEYQTADDGPTAAVVSKGYVIFNTESCELEVLDLAGKPVWKKWLGDPLMSMPAVADGKIYMCYPDSRGDRDHKLACFDLKTGNEVWAKKIPGEIITAPVVDDGRVFLASVDGTVACFESKSGELVWSEQKNATSSPAVWKDQCYFSRRTESSVRSGGKPVVKQQTEQIAARDVNRAGSVKDLPETARRADYLDYSKRSKSRKEFAQQSADGAVGFGGPHKGDGKIAMAMGNLGQASVCGVWSYQGSRPFMYRGNLYAAMADKIICLDPKTEKVLWEKGLQRKVTVENAELLDAFVSPPALVNGRLFLGTDEGSLICLDAESGEQLWSVDVGEPIVFQPAVVKGRVYVATNSGTLFCVETGDPKDDGWLMWGANASHDGKAVSSSQ